MTAGEADVLASIVTWSAECPVWQRDALRRLCVEGDLDEADLGQLLAICKGEAKGAPLTADHVRDPAAAGATVILRRIHGVRNVNALHPGEQLTFDKKGVTAIYGDNGSGKSGYARILKKVCRARLVKGETILSNIYGASAGTQGAAIDFTVGDQNKTADWTAGKPPNPTLSAVSVFDSRTANVHVDQTNDVAYTPTPLKILAALAQACQDLRKKLDDEKSELDRQTPAAIKNPPCKATTTVGRLLAGLSGGTSKQTVENLVAVSESDAARLETLNSDLAADPARTARQLQTLEAKLQRFTERLDALASGIGDTAAAALREKLSDYEAAREAAAVASTSLFSGEPLPGVGAEAWRALWEAARRYSVEQAYPGKEFPVTEAHSRCVLCQQTLDADAADRLRRFEAFVKDDTKRCEEETKATYDNAVAAFCVLRLSLADLAELLRYIRDDLADEALADALRRSVLANLWRHRHIFRHLADGSAPPDAVAMPIDQLRTHVTTVSERALALATDAGSEERRSLLAERDELLDRQWLSTVKADVLAEIDRRAAKAKLDTALGDTATKRITLKSSEAAEALVTKALRAQFTREVARLGAAELAVELRREGSVQGVPRFKVCLTRKPSAVVGEVLSEGEYRCVALAAFLAELATTEGKSTIVFDDPVSSLDHVHREAVAKRLAELGRDHQVIVFTHDIALLFLLNEACAEGDPKTHFAIRSVTRGPDYAGFCHPNPPLKAQPLDMVIEGIQRRLDNEQIHHQRGDHENWERTVRSLEEQLRTAWERAVEEVLGPVLKRMSNKVDTKGLAKVTVLSLEDCEKMRGSYGRCSTLLHSDAANLNRPLPQPDAIQAEITTLRDWVADLNARQGAVR
jgi:energy-coupling factor transporter ATP-binding protein EcfA2